MSKLTHSDLRRRDIFALSESKAKKLLWELTKQADEYAQNYREVGDNRDEGRSYCVMSPGQILDEIEDVALPPMFTR